MSRWADRGLIALVALNVLAVTLQSVESLSRAYDEAFAAFELVSVSVFSVEFVLRVWSAAERRDAGETGWKRRVRYLRSPLAVADLLAIAPFYLGALFAVDLRFLRILRLLRVLKLTRYSRAFAGLVEVARLQRAAFTTSFLILCVVLILTSSVMYVVEHQAQPEAFASIPSAMWWAVATLTTVGYGDVTPITPLGKLLAAAITVLGVGMVALPTSILATGFTELQARNRDALADEVDVVLQDGVVTREEAASLQALAEELGVAPETAQRILLQAQRSLGLDESEDCPHCGKTLS